MLEREALAFEEYAGLLARSIANVLRRHGKNIGEMQYTQKRVADVAIDLHAIASVIARTSRAIAGRREEASRREMDLTSVFVTSAKRRLHENLAAVERTTTSSGSRSPWARARTAGILST